MVIFKGDGSLDEPFSGLSERFKVFWTPPTSGYFMVRIRDNEDFKGAVEKVKKRPKWPKKTFLKEYKSLGALLARLWERIKIF